jgi:hypothetical protein
VPLIIRPFMQLIYRPTAVVIPVLLLFLASATFATDTNKPAPKAAEHKLQATLIWGTDEDKPENPEHELNEVDGGLQEKFRKIFKWKNYFRVGEQKAFSIRAGETKQLKLSHKCDLKIHQSDHEGVDVELIGEGKPLFVKHQSMPLKDMLILAGDDKNATAWFIVLKPE